MDLRSWSTRISRRSATASGYAARADRRHHPALGGDHVVGARRGPGRKIDGGVRGAVELCVDVVVENDARGGEREAFADLDVDEGLWRISLLAGRDYTGSVVTLRSQSRAHTPRRAFGATPGFDQRARRRVRLRHDLAHDRKGLVVGQAADDSDRVGGRRRRRERGSRRADHPCRAPFQHAASILHLSDANCAALSAAMGRIA